MIDESWYIRPDSVPDRTASGGVVARVENGQIYVALVKEVGVSDYVLPKGGVELGETLEQAARREIEEEAGITELRLIEKLGTWGRLDYQKHCWITTHYFLFTTRQVDGTPTDTEHHYGLAWFPIDNLPTIFWPEQRELIEMNRDRIVRLL